MPSNPLLALGLAAVLCLGTTAPSAAMAGVVAPAAGIDKADRAGIVEIGWRRGPHGHRHWRHGWRGPGWRYGYRAPYRPWRGYADRPYRYSY